MVLFLSARRRQPGGEGGSALESTRPGLNEHRHCQQQSSVGSVRRLCITVNIALRQTRVKITNELLYVRELLVEIIESKMRERRKLVIEGSADKEFMTWGRNGVKSRSQFTCDFCIGKCSQPIQPIHLSIHSPTFIRRREGS